MLFSISSSKIVDSPEPKGMNPTTRLDLFQHVPDTDTKKLKCSCICKCFGYFRYDEWPNLDADDEDCRI